ncbi:MAG: hypothetical protein LBK60_07675 [Verrucomicrobiales bacterium]|jgi:hypothetical protein|nr:hypothetical protein [Verrucomicrobiales bacterium]
MRKEYDFSMARKNPYARKTSSSEISVKVRCLLYFGAWLVALFSLIPSLRAIVFLPFFPYGLCKVFHFKNGDWMVWLIWLLYLIHGIITLSCRGRVLFFILYFMLIVFLVTNVIGCKGILSEMSHIN